MVLARSILILIDRGSQVLLGPIYCISSRQKLNREREKDQSKIGSFLLEIKNSESVDAGVSVTWASTRVRQRI